MVMVVGIRARTVFLMEAEEVVVGHIERHGQEIAMRN
jgi:hypothetical protein